jgi:hypothetical protein
VTQDAVPPIGPAHLAAFVAETAMVACLGAAAWSLGGSWPVSALLAVVAIVVTGAVWGRWCAPRARHRLPRSPRWALKVGLATVAVVAVLVTPVPDPWVLVAVVAWLLMVATLRRDEDHVPAG